MAELGPSDATLNAMSGTSDAEQEAYFPDYAADEPFYTAFYAMLYRLLQVCRRAGDLRVYKDGDLTFGVRAGKYFNGDTLVTYAGAAAQALTNNQTNYIYLTAAGALTVNTTGFPTPSVTPHVRLATILTAAGAYNGRAVSDGGDVTDHRGTAFIKVGDGVGPAARQDLMPNLLITAGAEAADKRTITIQARDAGNNNLAQRFLVRVWVATGESGAPSAAGNTVAVETGTDYAVGGLANASYKVISDANGVVAIGVTISGAATRYIMAEVDGRIYSSGAVNWAA